MADPTIPVDQDLGQLVMQAPEPIWKQIRKALGVESREQAAAMVQADPKAQEIVIEILGGGGETMLTDRGAAGGHQAPGSLVTDGAPAPAPLADRMYGGKAKKGQVKF